PGLSVLSGPPQQLEAIQFNLNHPQLKDQRVRQAISAAFDVETFTRDNMAGMVKPATGFIGWGSWAYDAGIQLPAFDMARARQLLPDAGYPNGGFPLRLITNAGNVYRQEEATVLQAQLKQLGIDASVEFVEFGKLLDAVNAKTFDVALFGFFTAYPD